MDQILTNLANWFLANGPIGVLCGIMLLLAWNSERRNVKLTDKLIQVIETNTTAFTRVETLVREMKR